MANRVDVGSIRRAQIVDAACRVINRKGIQNASLAEIEQETGISHGALTYHFSSKEGIILAVFDATIARIKEGGKARMAAAGSGWERLEGVFEFLITQKPQDDEFDCLHYTFLAQMSHRDDFRARLAAEYAEIRDRITEDLAEQARRGDIGLGDAGALAAIVQGTMNGLVMQFNADPGAMDREAVLRVFKSMLLGYLGPAAGRPPAGASHPPGKRRRAKSSGD